MKTLKLAPHIHTRHSDDSDWDLDRLVTILKRAGYDGALICDHDRTMDDATWQRIQSECNELGDRNRFVLVPGIEYQDPDHIVHMPVFGRAPFYGRSPRIGELLPSARADGAAAVFAHPRRREAWRRFDPKWAPLLAGIEVWNRKYDGIRPNTWALERSAALGVPGTVALDWHGPRQLYPLALRVPDVGSGSNEERAAAVVAGMVVGATRSTAFGVDVKRFDRGVLGWGSRSVEAVREATAPAVRRIEHVVRRGR